MWLYRLMPNPVERFYRGGQWIAQFRHATHWPPQAPEEWIASTTTVYGDPVRGLSTLDGALLRDHIAADPLAFLGPQYVARHGPEPNLLTKLLEAGQRLPVHYHPDDTVARERLGYPRGKTEAWFVIRAEPDSRVWLGFHRPVAAEELQQLLAARDSNGLLALLREVPVRPGDALYVPAGTPHAIGEGIVIVELQQASDLSVLLEWWPFDSELAETWHLGLTPAGALAALDWTVWDDERTRTNVRHVPATPGRHRLFPEVADPYFRGERVVVTDAVELEQGYQLLIVLTGSGVVEAASGETLPLSAGDAVLAAFAAGPLRLAGQLDVVRCLPGR